MMLPLCLLLIGGCSALDIVLLDGSLLPSSYNYTCPNTTATNTLSDVGCECSLVGVNFTTTAVPLLRQSGTGLEYDYGSRYSVDSNSVVAQCEAGKPCGICPAGTQCSFYDVSVSGDFYNVSICIPCMLGQYCPEGTVNPYSERFANLCPAGSLCSDPAVLSACDTGSFCTQAAFNNITCEAEVNGTRVAFVGNYCAENSTNPYDQCPAGYYCPDSATLIECPGGSYCPAGSVTPIDCWPLSFCSSGQSSAPIAWLGLLISLGSLLVFVAISIVYQRVWRSGQAKDAFTQTQRQKLAMFSNALRKLLNPDGDFHNFEGLTPKTETISFQFQDIGLDVKGKNVITGITGTFHPCRLIAVMGPSGCGKSTFIKVLRGKAWYGTTTGTLSINGEKDSVEQYKSEIGYVPQDNIVQHELTVRENLMFSALLRLDKHVSALTRAQIVDDVLELLQLSHIQDSVVGNLDSRGISGGEEKRVNVGLELVTNPTAVLVDEATSGLDSNTAYDLADGMRMLCHKLKWTIVMVIHQPRYSICQLFDDLLLLGKSGRTVYLGPMEQARTYFAEIGYVCPPLENPADYYLDAISGTVANTAGMIREELLYERWIELSTDERFSMTVPTNVEALRKQSVLHHRGSTSAIAFSELMRELDPTNSDYISIARVNEFVVALGLKFSPADLQAFFDTIDKNKDGVIDKDELLAALMPNGQEPRFKFALPAPTRRSSQHARPTSAHSAHSRDVEMQGVPKPQPKSKSDLSSKTVNKLRGSFRLNDDPNKAESSATAAEQPHLSIEVRELRHPVVQFVFLFARSSLKWWRDRRARMIDIGLIVTAAFVVGAVQGSTESLYRIGSDLLFRHLVISLFSCVGSLHVFRFLGVYYREVSCGVNPLSYYLAKITVDIGDVILRSLLFAGVTYGLTQPNTGFMEYLSVMLLLSWVWSGVGHVVSISLISTKALIGAVVAPLISGGFFCGIAPTLATYLSSDNYIMLALLAISPNRWSVETSTATEVTAMPSQTETVVNAYLEYLGFKYDPYVRSATILFCYGLLMRIVAFVVLVSKNRGLQR